MQAAAQQAVELKHEVQDLQQQLQRSVAAAKQAEQQLHEKVQQLHRSNSDKDSSIRQLEQQCQTSEAQVQVHGCCLRMGASKAWQTTMSLAVAVSQSWWPYLLVVLMESTHVDIFRQPFLTSTSHYVVSVCCTAEAASSEDRQRCTGTAVDQRGTLSLQPILYVSKC